MNSRHSEVEWPSRVTTEAAATAAARYSTHRVRRDGAARESVGSTIQ
jgi:hypothetical protein